MADTTFPPATVPRPPRFSREEWDARVQLAAAYRIVDHLGWGELIYNHISLRVPGPDPHFLINPFGLHYSEVRASNLVKVDVKGNVIGHSDWPINPAGFTGVGREPGGLVRVATMADFFDFFPMEWLADFLAAHPPVRLARCMTWWTTTAWSVRLPSSPRSPGNSRRTPCAAHT